MSISNLTNDNTGTLKSEYDKIIMNNFLVSLEPHYYHRLRSCKLIDCAEAFKYTLEEELALKFYLNNQNPSKSKPENKSTVNNNNNTNVNNQKPDRFCSHCKKSGHTLEFCRIKKNRQPQPSTSNGNSRTRSGPMNSLNLEPEAVTGQSTSEEEEEMTLNLLDCQ